MHCSLFFRIKGADDFRSVLKTKSAQLCRKKLKRVSKDLQRLRAANAGHSTAFDRMLDMAYGRVGKLPFTFGYESFPPSPIHSRKENICSPAYSPELATLLTSGISRTTKALQKHHLISPPGLPARAKSNNEDAVLLGPLSRRREYNIRWRFFRSECNKVYPPLQISPQHPANHTNTHFLSGPPVSFGFQNAAALQELVALAGSPSRSLTLRASKRQQRIQDLFDTNPFDGGLPVRWLRRRYQALLGRIPLLVPRLSPDANCKRTYDVQLAD
ncbi:hypothetical protein JVT61DRAFT_5421 [Boletus reticuloceps]|uniref:LYR motif-containing protein Cup1-like N-terminal domain-containing protein n=1 Tax=Boletus reticuloceps TaxID=495285 RepID=A0A8I2YYY5_9AGAM|nr:hypothetical protein JVT61DRAFT_5421 [Boletus reticuloceps]